MAVSRAAVWRDLMVIVLAGIALRAFFLPAPGHVVDLNTFGQWALRAADAPWNQAYERTDANYPPGAMLFFELIGRGYRAFAPVDPDRSILRLALKAPNVLFDALGSFVLYALARRFTTSHRRALLAAAIFAFNPAIVYDSALWGQNDSITTVSALAAIWCMVSRWRVAAWLLLAFAVLNKPPVLVLAPIFALEAFLTSDLLERRRRIVQSTVGIGGAIALGYVLALPFYTNWSFASVYGRMISWYQIGSSLYPYNSANAFNLYALFGDFFGSDTGTWFLVPLKYWADVAFIIVAALIFWRYTRVRDDRALVEASFLVMLAFFLILTEMHERYLIYALTFIPILAILDRRYLWCAAVLTLTQWLNLEYSLSYMWIESDKPPGINPHEFAPVLVHMCALANIGVFATVAGVYLGRTSGAALPAGANVRISEVPAYDARR